MFKIINIDIIPIITKINCLLAKQGSPESSKPSKTDEDATKVNPNKSISVKVIVKKNELFTCMNFQ